MSESMGTGHVLVIGGGPVAVGPAGRVLRAVGRRVTVADPNPATIMVDPEFADAAYAAPITPAGLARVIAAERPDALMVSLGAPAAIAAARTLHEQGVLRRYGTGLLDPLAYQDIPPAPHHVDVATLSDRHGRTAVVGTVEHVGPVAVVPAPSATEAMLRTAIASGGTVRFVGERVIGRTSHVTRSAMLAAAACGLPLAETVALLAIGADLPAIPAVDNVLVALHDTIGMGVTFPAAYNAIGELPDLPVHPAWLTAELRRLDAIHARIEAAPVLTADVLRAATRAGMADDRIAALRPELSDGTGVRRLRDRLDLLPRPITRTTLDGGTTKPAVLLLGPLPGDPADYAHACANGALALRRAGHRVAVAGLIDGIDGGVADCRYLVPHRVSDLLGAVRAEQDNGPFAGVIAQLGGPHALAIGRALADTGVNVIDAATPVADDEPGDVVVVALSDGQELFVGAIGEWIGWDELVLPAPSIGPRTLARLRRHTRDLATKPGALTVRFAVSPDDVVVRSVDVGASSLLAAASASTGVELAQATARLLLGASIAGLRDEGLLPPADPAPEHVAVRLRGGVLGLGSCVGAAYAEARAAAGRPLPTGGTVGVSVDETELRAIVPPVRALAALGFRVLADAATATTLRRHGVDVVPGTDADLVLTTSVAAAVTAEAVAAQRHAEPGTPPVRVPRPTTTVLRG